jgi:hypothetical protein
MTFLSKKAEFMTFLYFFEKIGHVELVGRVGQE